MVKPDFVVIGAGPAGAAFAYLTSSRGYRVHVYEQAPRPGMKPCGWALPSSVKRYVRIPSEAVITEIRGYRVFLDYQLLFEKYVKGWGWIINKPVLLELLLEATEKVEYRSPVKPRGRSKELAEAREAVVYATGWLYPLSPSEKINAVQLLYKIPSGMLEPGVVEVWFDSSMVGYYWVFPREENMVDIGVGGYLGFSELRSKLISFAKRRLEGKGEAINGIKGSRIVVAGIDRDLFLQDTTPVIGEAAGFVYPVSGEGIRPSIASAYALIESMDKGIDRLHLVKDIELWIKRQKMLLDAIKRASPKARGSVLRALPPEVMVGIGLGEARLHDIARALIRAPAAATKILKYLVKS